MFNFYILKSLVTGKYYIGSTRDVLARLKLHNTGKVQSTKSDLPWQIIYIESFIDLKSA
jgi:putative endonuclease